MASTTHEARQPDPSAEAKPEYRAKNAPNAEQPKDCHPVKPPAAPGSAAENHEDANQKCTTSPQTASQTGPQTASKDQHEKATG